MLNYCTNHNDLQNWHAFPVFSSTESWIKFDAYFPLLKAQILSSSRCFWHANQLRGDPSAVGPFEHGVFPGGNREFVGAKPLSQQLAFRGDWMVVLLLFHVYIMYIYWILLVSGWYNYISMHMHIFGII